jgi:uncharacterized protein DUF6152
MTRTVVLLVLAGACLFGITASAHHSFNAVYDVSREVTIEGKLVQFLYRNPHSWVHVEVTVPGGEVQRWAVEWGGSGQLAGQGVTRTTLKVGDTVVISGDPSRTAGDYKLKMNSLLRTSDGFGWGGRPGEVVD